MRPARVMCTFHYKKKATDTPKLTDQTQIDSYRLLMFEAHRLRMSLTQLRRRHIHQPVQERQ